jgi:pumilio RNA-binding family
MDDSNSKSLFSTQPVLPTHTEEPEPLDEDNSSPIGNLVRQTSSDWADRRVDRLMGLASTGLGARPKSLVDLIQVQQLFHAFGISNFLSLPSELHRVPAHALELD